MSQYQDSREGGMDQDLKDELDKKCRQYREDDEPSDRQKELEELRAMRAELLRYKEGGEGQESGDEDPNPPEKTLVLRRHR